MEKNKTVPDIEKLQHHDFDLDVDEQQRLQAIGDAEVNRVGILPETLMETRKYFALNIFIVCYHDFVKIFLK